MRKILFLTTLLLASCSTTNVSSLGDLIENEGETSLYLNKSGGYEVITPGNKLVEIKYNSIDVDLFETTV